MASLHTLQPWSDTCRASLYIYIHTHTHTCMYIYIHTHGMVVLCIYLYIHTHTHLKNTHNKTTQLRTDLYKCTHTHTHHKNTHKKKKISTSSEPRRHQPKAPLPQTRTSVQPTLRTPSVPAHSQPMRQGHPKRRPYCHYRAAWMTWPYSAC
jgi:hypothetical protein